MHIKLKLDNGTTYPFTGKLAFVESNVSQTTGTFALRAEFPNPDRLLLPGMYVRALIEEGVAPNSYLVPQRAVTRNTKGEATAMFVAADGKVEQRVLSISRNVGNNWLVSSGIHDGDRVIVEGTLLVRPGQAVSRRRGDDRREHRRGPLPQTKRPAAFGHDAGRRQWIASPPRPRTRRCHVFSSTARSLPGSSPSSLCWAVCWRCRTLSISQYPQIAPTTVRISATYPGAAAATVENSVTKVIEQGMTGIDNLDYMTSTSTSTGPAQITLTFTNAANPDTAQVQVQNKLQLVTPLLPQIVQNNGLSVTKSSTGFLMVIGFVSTDGKLSSTDLADYVASTLNDTLRRIDGVGDTQLFGSGYAMRIWMDPDKLAKYALMPSDISAAIKAQNTQVSAGQLGGLPARKGQQLNATVTAQSRLQTPEQFRDIILKSATDGSLVRLSDVATVELGAESYTTSSTYNGMPAAGLAINLATGANAINTAEAVQATITRLSSTFPQGVKAVYPYDTTPFVRLSIEEVVKTLFEAIGLVFIVMFVFLQNFRATLIPTLAVPVVLLGTFGVLAVLGYSINTLTMFAMVLAIGLLVDDAIVVVENVERVMQEEGLSPKEATRKSMDEITGALVGIATVLSAVFVPMAFFGGSVGVIYRQFSVTIVSAMILSIAVALILTPALCATILRAPKDHGAKTGVFGWFNRTFERGTKSYRSGAHAMIDRSKRFLLIFVAIIVAMGVMFVRLPSSFLPQEDQGILITSVQLPVGATQDRTLRVLDQVRNYYQTQEKDAVEGVFTAAGFGFGGQGQNIGLAFIRLKPFDERKSAKLTAQAVAMRATMAFQKLTDARVFALAPPAIQGFGNSNGFDFYLQDINGAGHAELIETRNKLLAAAGKSKLLANTRPNGQEDEPQYQIEIDQEKASAFGLSLSDYQHDAVDRLGQRLRQRLHRPRPRQESLSAIG